MFWQEEIRARGIDVTIEMKSRLNKQFMPQGVEIKACVCVRAHTCTHTLSHFLPPFRSWLDIHVLVAFVAKSTYTQPSTHTHTLTHTLCFSLCLSLTHTQDVIIQDVSLPTNICEQMSNRTMVKSLQVGD